ncbi:hypothetical protein OY671_011188, partial [Metschnikowia pulcherrima]
MPWSRTMAKPKVWKLSPRSRESAAGSSASESTGKVLRFMIFSCANCGYEARIPGLRKAFMIKIKDGMALWSMKSEPDAYSWDDLVAEGEGTWDGVRNHSAARNSRTMKEGDLAFFYHSNIGSEIVGVITISKGGITDPTDPDGKWAAVKVKPVEKSKHPVTLKQI